jgi:hypothetical protein
LGLVSPDIFSTSVNGSGVLSATGPQAFSSSLGISRPDNTSITITEGVLSVPTATTSILGLARPDNTSITVASGVLSVPTATSSVFGIAKVDNITISSSGGILSNIYPIATNAVAGMMQPDNSSVTISAGVISVATATSSILGVVKVDGTSITSTSGVISVPTASSSVLGISRPDNTSITVSSGVLTATKASTTQAGVVTVDGTTITSSGGVLSLVNPSSANLETNNYWTAAQSVTPFTYTHPSSTGQQTVGVSGLESNTYIISSSISSGETIINFSGVGPVGTIYTVIFYNTLATLIQYRIQRNTVDITSGTGATAQNTYIGKRIIVTPGGLKVMNSWTV